MRYVLHKLFWMVVAICICQVLFHHGASHLINSARAAIGQDAPSETGAVLEARDGSYRIGIGFTPGNAEALVVDAIRHAHRSVDVAAYSFTNPAIVDALIAAAQRGVQVRVVMDRGQYQESSSAANYIRRAGVPVKIDAQYAAMHDKFMVLDGDTVETGSFNYTRSAESRNAENVLILRNTQAAQTYDREWQRLWNEAEGE
jgi:phosphatidylserine/phosphatidylglycerophosphate/cardiolipin synthase-like enzyme